MTRGNRLAEVKNLAVVFFIFLCPIIEADQIVDDRINDDPQAILKKNLPIYPIKEGQIIIAAGLTFDRVPWTHGIFDPSKQIPSLINGANGTVHADLAPTPVDYFVTEDLMISFPSESKWHFYEMISYRFKDETAHLQSVSVLSYDNVPYCICFGNMPIEAPALWSGARLEMINGKPEIDVGQTESGTGAFNTHAYFEVRPEGPKLVSLTQGSRGR